MTRFVQTLAIAIVLLFAVTMGIALAADAPSCASGTTPQSKIEADIAVMKKDKGWEATTLTVESKPSIVKELVDMIISLPWFITTREAEARLVADTRHILWLATPGKPNAYIVFLDAQRCWMADLPIPIGKWKLMLSSVERGA